MGPMQKQAPKGPKGPNNKNSSHKKPGMNPKKPHIPGIPGKPPKGGFWGNMASVVLVFFTIMLLYSFITERQEEVTEVPVSEIAQDVRAGLVEKIEIEGEELNVSLKLEEGQDEGERVFKESKKEVGPALSSTLSNYGVTPEQLEQVSIEI